MATDALTRLEADLTESLRLYDWKRADELGRALAIESLRRPDAIPESAAKRILANLRRKRRFLAMAGLADALIQSGQRTAAIRRAYATALIDQGNLTAAQLLLDSILQDAAVASGEAAEAHGLLGRIYKQLYVNANAGGPAPATRPFLDRALKEYHDAYRVSPRNHFWHGINVVALLNRAHRDGIPVSEWPDRASLAREVLATLQSRADEATDAIPAWETATALEAWVALSFQEGAGNDALQHAESKAIEYAGAADADSFEVASTLRQLLEVWQLNDQEPPGSRVLPVLRAALLRREGGGVRIQPQEARRDLEKVFGADKFQAVSWYKRGLECCQSVARIEKRGGVGYGTAWLVRGQDFFPGETGPLLVTNAHVISPSPYPHALLPSQARANFQMMGVTFDIDDEDVVWSSPVAKFDATFIRVRDGAGKLAPLQIGTREVQMTDPPARLYVIGHPGGGDLAFSLQDNFLLACNASLLHYRTPTAGGSSGSPVFESDDWQVVGLHHAGDAQMPRIDGKEGTYEANEGIAIRAIQQGIQSS